MSEPKRATFSTISTQKSEVKKVKEKSKTIRFSLTLPESNEKSCPEYNYRDLLNSAEKKSKIKDKTQGQVNGLNHLDPFDENDDDVKRIARQFEEKYGIPKKKRRGKRDDYADIGAGYDESDSFIDNTDAYDEMVPEDVTTVHGGFYINSGALEFKQVDLSESESSESEPSDNEKTPSRKRIIEDTEESESEEEKEDTKVEHAEKKQKIEANGVQKAAKKKIITTEEIAAKKKKVEEIQKKKPVTVKELLREKREEFDMTIPPELVESPQKETKPSASNTINDVIESVVNAGRVENIDETSKDSSCSSDAVAVVSAASSESDSSRDGLPAASEQPKQETEIPIVKLPDSIPEHILKIINDIKKAAENSEGKVKFFSGHVNNMLLSLETNSRKLVRSVRVQIYEHLAPFVKCKKDTLMRRAKNLLLDQERSKLKDPLLRLKVIVDSLMPIVKKNYEKEFQKVRDEMFLASATSANSETDVASKVRRLPRKKFPWSEEARKTLQEIILIQKKCFTMEGTRKETFEENLESFLKASVLPIWTDGFMTITVLMKQAKQILEKLEKPKQPPAPPMSPITLDVQATATVPPASFNHSPVKNLSLSPSCSGVSGVTVIPIPQSNVSPKLSTNGPKLKHSPQSKPNEITVSVNKKEPSMAAEISPVSKETDRQSLLIPSKSSVTITSVDLRTNNVKEDDAVTVSVSEPVTQIPPLPPPPSLVPKPTLKQRILNEIPSKPRMDDCQIIDLTESPVLVRKPGPKSKTKYIDGSVKPKRVKESPEIRPVKTGDLMPVKPEEITGSQALNQIITGLTKYGSNSTDVKANYKDSSAVIEDDMEQVMKDLKELQQLQEHARKNDLDIMAPSSSPVSVIAFNTNYASNQVNDLSTTKERKLNDPGYQDIFQKHLFQEPQLLKPAQSSSVYNSNVQPVQPKNSYNSINNFSYSPGSISNSINNIRYSQSSSKYTSSMNHLPTNPTGATNHTDDFALFQNFLYQYGFHNSSGSKQKSPP